VHGHSASRKGHCTACCRAPGSRHCGGVAAGLAGRGDSSTHERTSWSEVVCMQTARPYSSNGRCWGDGTGCSNDGLPVGASARTAREGKFWGGSSWQVGPRRDTVFDRWATLTREAHLAVMWERGNRSGPVTSRVWASAAESSPQKKNPFSFSKSISKYSGVNKSKKILRDLRKLWKFF
jgi:hypothetical protein